MSLVLAGCGAPAQPAPAKPTSPQPTGDKPSVAQPTLTREQQLVEAAKKEGEVTLWFHQFPDAPNAMKPFLSKYPFLKVKTWDSSGAELLAKLTEEIKAGRRTVDVLILSSEIADAYKAGMLTEYEFPNAVGWPNQPKHNFFRAITGVARMAAIYNTNLIQPADVPKTWDDLKSAKWTGKTFASTSGEDTPLMWAFLWRDGDKLNWDKSFAFWGDFFKTKPMIGSGFTGAIERLAAGEFALFPAVGFGAAFRVIMKGAPVAYVPVGPVTGDIGAISLMKDAPHPNSAKLLIDWLTSPEGLMAYANSSYNFPLDPGVAAVAKSSAQFKSLGIAYDPIPREVMTPENLKKSSDFWMKGLGIK